MANELKARIRSTIQTLVGTSASDTLVGTSGADSLMGLGGDDRLYAGDGDDWLDGGSGSDFMVGGRGNDSYVVDTIGDVIREAAGEGYDRVIVNLHESNSVGGGPLPDVAYRMAGGVEEAILAGKTNHVIGNDLNNIINAEGSGQLHVRLEGGAGDDGLALGAGGGIAMGEAGDDDLFGGAGRDLLYGGTGTDYLTDRAGDDVSWGGSGRDLISTGDGNDTAFGGDGNDQLEMRGGGHDLFYGGAGDDLLSSQEPSDGTMEGYGGSGNDQMTNALEGAPRMIFYGGSGHDAFVGGDRDDLFYGGEGKDHFWNSTGVDSFVGGAEADVAVLTDPKGDADHWIDFSTAEGDYIDIASVTDNQIAKDPFAEGFARLVDITLKNGEAAVAVEIDANGGGDEYERLLILHGQTVASLSGYELFDFNNL